MSFQRYPLSTLQKVSQYVRSVLTVPAGYGKAATAIDADADFTPDSLDSLGDLFRLGDLPEDHLPAPNQEGRWYLSTLDGADALNKLPGLWLKPGIRLVTYLQQQPDAGQGLTWAVPELLSTTEYLESAIAQANQTNQPPRPSGALPSVMGALEGDGSLASFLASSVFLREIREFGRYGKNTRWSHHRFVSDIPSKVDWQWRTQLPKDFAPKVVTLPDEQIVVEFFSCRTVPPIALFRHVDRYQPNSYQPQNTDQVIAVMASKSAPTRS
ncbi:hypothetical protein C7271_21190 [filamentous cyanobacterium CCP5]|nr:hypothetical protein C7271_21190 [filamentous cyanobacterium CCP5]